ncbi:MAG: hypothetical protein U0163_18090 [Gemmatimonadaceae bacterium]
MRRLLVLALTGTALVACSDRTADRSIGPFEPFLAKGGPSTKSVDFDISDAGFSLTSDGKGTYRNGICGVVATSTDAGLHLAPAEGSIPKSQRAACAGIAPRAGTVRFELRHVSDNPHVDDSQSPPGSGVFNLGNVKFGSGAAQAVTINSSAACGTAGMRFTPVTYPGSDSVIREDLGGGAWHMYTQPWPNNKGYCENNGVVSYWHVSFDLQLQILN